MSKVPNNRVENVDYKFMDPAEDDIFTGIMILQGPYINTVYTYGSVKLSEDNPIDDTGQLHFEYTVLDPAKSTIDKLRSDKDFVRELGQILYSILVADIDYLVDNPPKLEIRKNENN